MTTEMASRCLIALLSVFLFLRLVTGLHPCPVSEKWGPALKNILCFLIATYIAMGFGSDLKVRALEKRVEELELKMKSGMIEKS